MERGGRWMRSENRWRSVRITTHALDRFTMAHPGASRGDLLLSLGLGEPIDEATARPLRGLPHYESHPDERYVLGRGGTGMFVLKEAEGTTLAITYLRFQASQREFVVARWPRLTAPLPSARTPEPPPPPAPTPPPTETPRPPARRVVARAPRTIPPPTDGPLMPFQRALATATLMVDDEVAQELGGEQAAVRAIRRGVARWSRSAHRADVYVLATLDRSGRERTLEAIAEGGLVVVHALIDP